LVRNRNLLVALVAALCAVGAVAYVVVAAMSSRKQPKVATLASTTAARPALKLGPVVAGPRPRSVLVRAVDPKRATLEGRVYRVSPDGSGRPRLQKGPACLRFYAAGGHALCLTVGRSGVEFKTLVLDSSMRVKHTLTLTGLPSRARVAPNGRIGAMTTFVTGDSYTEAGQFSTRTTLVDLVSGRQIADLESFTVTKDGKRIHSQDFNFWGVTFAKDSDEFYATLATGNHHYLVHGRVSTRSLAVVRDGVECPSLSPDGTRIAYKSRDGKPWHWRLHVYDLRSGADVAISERRPIDDQAEWLDNRRLLYGIGVDVWVAPADGTGQPQRFLANAASPSTQR
jgi:WD40-like Beta Propeller Repeat